jgi:hypothetical protein
MNEVQTQNQQLIAGGALLLATLPSRYIFHLLHNYFLPLLHPRRFSGRLELLYRRAAGVCKLGETHAVCKTTNIRIIMFPLPRARR